jgi:hypothetical protein
MTLPTAMALSSTNRSNGMSMISFRFAASCGYHGRFTVHMALAFPGRGRLSEVGVSSLPVAKTQNPGMKSK